MSSAVPSGNCHHVEVKHLWRCGRRDDRVTQAERKADLRVREASLAAVGSLAAKTVLDTDRRARGGDDGLHEVGFIYRYARYVIFRHETDVAASITDQRTNGVENSRREPRTVAVDHLQKWVAKLVE